MDYSFLSCALAYDQHFLEKAIRLSCGHSTCQKCIPNNEDVICLICGQQNETDLTTEQEESLVIRSMFSTNIDKLYEVLSDRFQDSVFSMKGRKDF